MSTKANASKTFKNDKSVPILKRDSFRPDDIWHKSARHLSSPRYIISKIVAGCCNRAPWNRRSVSNRRKISVFRLFLRDLYGLSSAIRLAERVSVLQTHAFWFKFCTLFNDVRRRLVFACDFTVRDALHWCWLTFRHSC